MNDASEERKPGEPFRITPENAREMQAKGAEAKKRKNQLMGMVKECARQILTAQMELDSGARKMFQLFGMEPTRRESVLLMGMLRAWKKIYSEQDIKGLETFIKLSGLHPEQEMGQVRDDNEIRITISDA